MATKPMYKKQKAIEIADLEILEMKLSQPLSQPCHYCGHVVIKGERLNGLHRLNAKFGYNDENTVSCCESCNNMKECLTVNKINLIIDWIRFDFSYEKCR